MIQYITGKVSTRYTEYGRQISIDEHLTSAYNYEKIHKGMKQYRWLYERHIQKVIIIGAGISGLTAAHVLNRNGLSARVIEAMSRVGGRMTSDRGCGHIIDRGAQFLSTEYSLILELLQQLNLSQRIRQTSQCS